MRKSGWFFLLFFLMFSFVSVSSGSPLCIDGVSVNKKIKCLKEIRDKNVVKQSLDYSCGPAGLATLLNIYLHDSVGEKQIIKALMKSIDIAKVKERHGFSLLDLKNFAEKRGYRVTGYKMDIDFLKQINAPVLVPIKFKNFRHFIVIKAVVGDRVFIADPAMGNMSMKIDRFLSIWQGGIGLVVEETPELRDPFRPPWQMHRTLMRDLASVPDYKVISASALESTIRTTFHIAEW